MSIEFEVGSIVFAVLFRAGGQPAASGVFPQMLLRKTGLKLKGLTSHDCLLPQRGLKGNGAVVGGIRGGRGTAD